MITRQEMKDTLMQVLPYPPKWYDELADKRLKAIYYQNVNKLVQRSIMLDEERVRARVGLTPLYATQQNEQLTLF